MRKLVQLRGMTLDPTARRLGACYDVFDLRRVAKRRIPRPVFDYVDGAADAAAADAAAAVAASPANRGMMYIKPTKKVDLLEKAAAS